MYTYIVIDDERLIRLGLISKVKEIKSEEFTCIGEAANGQEGLLLIRETKPDIVITDMKMAKMDGVEFLKRLQKEQPGLPVIVISGYKAFDYMNQAIEHRVVGYVLKPFSSEELEKQLLKAVARLEQQRSIVKMQEKSDRLEQRMEGMEFLKMIIEPWNVEQEEEGEYATDHWHLLVSFYTNLPEALTFLRECVSRYYGKEGYLLLENPGINGQYFLLFDAGEEAAIGQVEEKLPECFSLMKRKQEEGKLFAAASERFRGLPLLNRAYQKNDHILRDVYLTDHYRVFYEKTYEKHKRKLFTEDELVNLLLTLKYEQDGVKKAMEAFFGRFSVERDSLLEIGAACKKLLARVDEWAVENQVDTDDIMAVFYQRYRFLESLEKMEKEISGYVNLISLSIRRKSYGDDYLYERMNQYIQENYSKKITLQTLADQFYVSAAQCSNILKERLKKGLNLYLLEIRIEKAKELLDNTTMSAEQISREVGYPNPKYFFRMFKQVTTFTPIEYRNRRK